MQRGQRNVKNERLYNAQWLMSYQYSQNEMLENHRAKMRNIHLNLFPFQTCSFKLMQNFIYLFIHLSKLSNKFEMMYKEEMKEIPTIQTIKI